MSVTTVGRIPKEIWDVLTPAQRLVIKQSSQVSPQKKKNKKQKGKNKRSKKSNVAQKVKKNRKNAFKTPPIRSIVDRPIPASKVLNFEQKNVLSVLTDFKVDALNQAFLAFLGYLGGIGVFADTKTTGLLTPGAVLLPAIAYLFEAVQDLIKGTVQGLSDVPRVFQDLINALKAKTATFHTQSVVSYSWNRFPTNPQLNQLAIGDGFYALTYPNAVDSGSYNNLLIVVGPVNADPDAYPALLKVIGDIAKTGFLQIIPLDGSNVMAQSIAAFARGYRYHGLNQVTTNGWWRDLENEAFIDSPMYSAFVDYVQPDVRVPRVLLPWAGGSEFTMWSLSTTFNSHFNRVPIILKQIDFEEIYTTIVLWMSFLKEQAQQFDPNAIEAQPFTFSQQSFRIMLRQALLNVFKDTQFLTQFEGSVAYDGNTNCFVPLLATSGTAARSSFGQMVLPSLFVENLAALRGRNSAIPGKKSKLNVNTRLPVLGRYYQDEVFNPQYVQADGVTFVNLFSAPAENIIRLTDMFMAAGPTGYVDPNSDYYQGILSDWNMTVLKLAKFSAETKPIVSDAGPAGMGVLAVTKIQQGSEGELYKKREGARRSMFHTIAMRNCANVEPRKLERTTSKNKLTVEVIPAASVVSLNTLNILSATTTTSEQDQFYQTVWTPVMRENTTEDAVNTSMIMTETGETCTTTPSSVTQTFGAGVFAVLSRYAEFCVTGIGKDNTNEYTAMMKQFAEHSKAGMLGALIGGLGSMIGIPPEIAQAVGSILPI